MAFITWDNSYSVITIDKKESQTLIFT